MLNEFHKLSIMAFKKNLSEEILELDVWELADVTKWISKFCENAIRESGFGGNWITSIKRVAPRESFHPLFLDL